MTATEETQTPPYNLLDEAWLPVKRASGAIEFISPAEITGRHKEDPILALATPRADLDGAGLQFLIALLQTTFAPKNDLAWYKLLFSPPSPQTLAQHFEVVRGAFNLNGDGPNFMQPLEGIEGGASCPITDLWVNSPGENTRKKNSDFFIKRNDAPMSHAAAALSLFAMQTNAYGGGPGYRTSVRGGGPLSTIVLGETLWSTLWYNVLNASVMGGRATSASADIFPWCGETRQSDAKKGGVDTNPTDVHALQVYWAMPWLIQIQEKFDISDTCTLYPTTQRAAYLSFEKTNYGVNYVGPWRHPLTPYRFHKKADVLEYISQKGTSRNFRYSNWPGLCHHDDEPADVDSGNRTAHVVARFVNIRDTVKEGAADFNNDTTPQGDFRLFIFGYEMDNAKTLQWNQAEMPIWTFDDPHQRDLLATHAQHLIATAERYEEIFYHSARKLIGGKVESIDEKGNASWDVNGSLVPDRSSTLIEGPIDALWNETQPKFFAILGEIKQLLDQFKDDLEAQRTRIADLYLQWRKDLYQLIQDYFERLAPSDMQYVQNAREVVHARKELKSFGWPENKNWNTKYTPN